ncbi:hypothetical protein ES319_D02G105700v1 [Gossypium barbadense]|uniref:Cytochrome f n=1 Tax=Gossypium barbadense TaxID=3634 RepID=A0A5J5SHM0_GOSBA|nr:hypothetical protein ES319_D02G105700v1 [Gossypium barbadense]
MGNQFEEVRPIYILELNNGLFVQVLIEICERACPVPGKKYSEITFPILSPDPASNKDAHFLKYPIYVGGNRGRGQIYPDGNKSNNTVYNATATGIVRKIIRKEKGGYEITITDALDGHQVVDIIPPGPERNHGEYCLVISTNLKPQLVFFLCYPEVSFYIIYIISNTNPLCILVFLTIHSFFVQSPVCLAIHV